MGIVVIIIIIAVFIAIANSNNTSSSSSSTSTPRTLSFRARKTTKDGINLILLEIKGPVSTVFDNSKVPFTIEVNDVTTGESIPIICAIESLQAENVPVLHIVSSLPLKYRDSILPNWAPIAFVPTDALTFPYKGERKVQFKLKLFSTPSINRRNTITYKYDEFGYLERKDNRKKYDILAAKIAFAVSASDKELHKNEAKIIKDWVQKRVEIEDNDEFKNEINKALQDEIKLFKKDSNNYNPNLEDLVNEINEFSTTAEKYELLELLLKIIGADDEADKSEMKTLQIIVNILGIDDKKYKEMRDIHLPASMMRKTGAVDIDEILGITTNMCDSDIRKHLREEYKKWNSLASHSDKDRREQAQYMLKLIGQRRAQL